MKKVAYLGPENSFTGDITKEIFKNENLISMPTIRKIIISVENDELDFGVVPLENFYNGEIRETLDTLTEASKTRILMEKYSKIVHCIGALKGHTKILKILSKDHAIEQCSKYISSKYPNATPITTLSTAEAVEVIHNNKMLDAGAIASENALKKFNFEILSKDLCPNNKTRFAVVGKAETKSTGDDKTLLVIHPDIDRPGVLYNTLKFFYEQNINLTSIQSRPDGKNGYYFYIELVGHETDKKVKEAIDKIKNFLGSEKKFSEEVVKILGSYPNSHWKEE